MEAEIREMPAFEVAYVRKIGPYGKEICEAAFGELMQWAGPRGHVNGPMLMLYWDNPEVTPKEKCRVDACAGVPEGTKPDGRVGIQKLRSGPYAVCRFETAGDFQRAWEEAFAWVVNGGYECDDAPTYELYHNDASQHPEGKWIFDICIPLKSQ